MGPIRSFKRVRGCGHEHGSKEQSGRGQSYASREGGGVVKKMAPKNRVGGANQLLHKREGVWSSKWLQRTQWAETIRCIEKGRECGQVD